MQPDRSWRLDELIEGAEELLTSLADAHDPGVQQLRDRVDHALNDARRSLETRSNGAAARVRDLAATVDDYVHDYPWLTLLTGVLVAGTVAYISGTVAGMHRQAPSTGASAI